MVDHPPDTPELAAAVEILRQIYWREYGRGWREAIQRLKEVLEREQVPSGDNGETAP